MCFQPLSPSTKAFASEAERAEYEVSVLRVRGRIWPLFVINTFKMKLVLKLNLIILLWGNSTAIICYNSANYSSKIDVM